MRRVILGAGLLAGLAGCAGTQNVSTGALVDSQVSIREAEEAGAVQVPDAARHLQLAKEQTAEARKLLDGGDRDQAALYLQRAEADAQLALALAKEAPARAEAERAMEQVKALQNNPQTAPPATGGSGASAKPAQPPQPAARPAAPAPATQSPQPASPQPVQDPTAAPATGSPPATPQPTPY
ncbi:DUF4398 domain-containing protein [Aggregicoccus sp. 17bor-14]|uniref:DUF4398 domain-containing protein n=1 Tax=Myxococcaceae TaxID=31 RepID=UPI00129C1109|nr:MULTISPECIES: lipoprotein [Myxococcaceae]MBF5044808.1 DUF4398 domain-containing protein [Simulacricoccus sp. 17bor-14]MRI90552.1 DUF4398 domain-containing protein [Aggregicoccus sp. 17bor-14]